MKPEKSIPTIDISTPNRSTLSDCCTTGASILKFQPELGTLCKNLVQEGYPVLTFDFRRHGDSPGDKYFASIGMDVYAGVNYLTQNGYNNIACMGASKVVQDASLHR